MEHIKLLKRQNIEKVIITILVLSMTVIACNISSAKESTIYGNMGEWLSDDKTSVIVYSVDDDVYFNPVTGDLNPMYIIKFQIKNPTDYNISINSLDMEIYHPEKTLKIHRERTDKKPSKLAPGEMLFEPEADTVGTYDRIFPSQPTKFNIEIHLEDMGTSSYSVSLTEAEPTPTKIPTPKPTFTPTPTPTPTPSPTPLPTRTPAPLPSPSPYPKPTGFEAIFAIAGLLAITAYFIIKQKRYRK
jgi:hypothetical protein